MDEQMIQSLSEKLSKIILDVYEQGRNDALLGKKECDKSADKVLPACSLTASQLRKLCAKDERYSGFKMMAEPKSFMEMFQDVDIDSVSIYSVDICKVKGQDCLIGYCGAFSWINNKIIPLDFDSYDKSMTVLGYEIRKIMPGHIRLLVGNDW